MATTDERGAPPMVSEFAELFGDDAILPAQFFDRHWESAEKSLIAAALENALQDYMLYLELGEEGRKRLKAGQTHRWLNAICWLTDLCSDKIFSLRWVCDALGLDAEKIAAKIAARSPIEASMRNPVTRHTVQLKPLRPRSRWATPLGGNGGELEKG